MLGAMLKICELHLFNNLIFCSVYILGQDLKKTKIINGWTMATFNTTGINFFNHN